ncbi:hypothetical protein PbJCM13498_38740 [Prolixibacter bellariivorans]|uniref:Uncharacterized protein n=1 Tax=Prolixibacter bellariivorans TaxID=314319 RepID=A0A5M4B542_9BACT|nr:hypothetical protein PbJCM13498_38740 [Prolixibacter bellariivorans]
MPRTWEEQVGSKIEKDGTRENGLGSKTERVGTWKNELQTWEKRVGSKTEEVGKKRKEPFTNENDQLTSYTFNLNPFYHDNIVQNRR